MVEHAMVIGIGGTGAKCVEAVIHLAVSGHSPKNIYPILIDQDFNNGNVERCKNVIQSYNTLRELAKSSDREWFFTTSVDFSEKLLPLVPQISNQNFGAAIGLPSMTEAQQAVVKSLFLPFQLNEPLDTGYKKRAHMGSILMQKMLEEQQSKQPNEKELKYFIEKIKKLHKPHLILFGSLFGGTGASGLIPIGKYLKREVSNAYIKGVFFTPYFMVGKSNEGNKNSNLVKSDADMQAVKIALEIYKNEIKNSFDSIYLIGSELDKLINEFPSKKDNYGGREQENPAHIFELIAALVTNESSTDNSNNSFSYVADTISKNVPLIFVLPNSNSNIDEKNKAILNLRNSERLMITHDFAYMLYKVKNHSEKAWWERQPWVNLKFKNELTNWANRYISWWNEMSNKEWNGHRWENFSISYTTVTKEYKFSAFLSRYLKSKNPDDLSNIFYTVEKIEKVKRKNYHGNAFKARS